MSKYTTLVKNSFIFALGNFGSKIIIFFLVPLYTNVLTTEEYGTADLVFTFSQLLMPIISLAIYNSIIRFGLQNKDNPEDTLYCGMVVWFIGCLFSITLIPILNYYEPITQWKGYLILHVNASVVLVIFQNYLKVKDENLKYSIISIIQTLILAVLNIIFLLVLKFGVRGYLLSNVFSCIVAIIISVVLGKIIDDFRKGHLRKILLLEMIKYSLPLILNNIAWWIIQSTDKVMIELYVGISALGLYSVATRIPSFVNVFVSIFQQAWGISSILEMDPSNDNNFYKNVFEIYIVIVFFACILINSFIKPFMHIYVSSEFFIAWTMTPILVVSAAAFSSVAAFYGSIYGALKKSTNNMITTIIGAIVNVLMNYLLINKFGVMGAVVGTMISYFILSIARMIDVNRYVKININYKNYFLNCIIVTASAVFIMKDCYLIHIVFCSIFILINWRIILNFFSKIIVFRRNNF